MHQIATFDIGTTSIKAALFTTDGTMCAFKQQSLQPESIDTPAEWVHAFESILHRFHSDIQKNAQLVIVISGHGPSTIYLSSRDEVLCYISWQSQKKIPMPQEPSYYLPQVEYVRQHSPEVFAQTALLLPPAEYLAYLLTRQPCVCVPHTHFIPNMWNTQSIRTHAYDTRIFPSPILSGDVIGTAVSEWARSLHIEHATVVAGGLDYISAALGAGMLDTHNLFLRCGTSVVFNVTSTTRQAHTSLSQPSDAIAPSFILTGLTAKHFNIGFTIPLFDQIYHAMLSGHALTQIPPIQLHAQLHACDPTIKNFVDAIVHDILTTQTTEHHITERVAAHIPSDQHSIVYASILVTLIQRVVTCALQYHRTHNVATPVIAVSGGHAMNTHLMQLLALFLNADIETYTPVYTELRGNFIFGLKTITHSKDITDIPSSATQIIPTARYSAVR